MNKQESDIMNILLGDIYTNQRALAEKSGHSLGVVNRSLKSLTKQGYLDKNVRPTSMAMSEAEEKKPRNAIILAAGFGMRMVPINTETPKGLLEINKEPLIERIIKQLHEAEIYKVYIVVGFMKEQYEYLIDEYGVELVVNRAYATKNNLHSMKKVLEHLSNTYIIPCDVWCEKNPFHKTEFYSWYMVSDLADEKSSVRVNRKMELVIKADAENGNAMIGICYLLEEQASEVRNRIRQLCMDSQYDDSFWEEALYENGKMIVYPRIVSSSEVVEINTYEQLRKLDGDSDQLKSDAISTIKKVFHVPQDMITDINVLKKGMTNRSFLFKCNQKRYIMRVPGEGTDQLINRRQEASVYQQIKSINLCDSIIYINPENGYKITEYYENARVCNPFDLSDLEKCMGKLRAFHNMKLRVQHEFDLFEKIEFYEKLWGTKKSVYRDYTKTKSQVMSLKPYIDDHVEEKVLTHIDAVADNFLFVLDENGAESIRLIDWEYAGMQDPHVDIAMFCIYSLYDRDQVDQLIDIYFENQCPIEIRLKIYCYISVCGLLWSNWCEYKSSLGIEFGEYSLKQYRYAKDFYKIVQSELEEEGDCE